MCCSIELKILWGLYRTLESSHINFQLNRTTHGRAGASPKWPFWAYKAIPCDFWPFFERRQKRHFWALLGALVCLIVLVTFFWAKPVYVVSQAIYVRSYTSNFVNGQKVIVRSPKMTGICSGKKVLKSANFGSKKLKFQTNCWKCTQMVKISWLRNLSKNFRFLSKNRRFLAKIEKCRSWPIFDKVDFGDFRQAPAPPCAVRLSWKFCEGSILP